MDNLKKTFQKNADSLKKNFGNAKKNKDNIIKNIGNTTQILKKNVANITKGKDKIMKNINNVRQIINKGTNKVAASIGMDKLFKNYAYPLNNYEFNYKGFVENNYKPEKLGVRANGSVRQFKHNLRQTSTYFDGLIIKGNPNKNTVAGVSDVPYENVEERNRKNGNRSIGMPYLKFRNDYSESEYPTKGKFSSSYFVQSGFCPVKSAINKEECKAQDPNYTWIPNPIQIPKSVTSFFSNNKDKIHDKKGNGNCFKPRYSYVNNAAESDLTSGMIPSLIDDIADLNPANLLGVSIGKPVMGNRDNEPARFQLLPCVEGFENNLNKNINYQQKILNENISKQMENFQSDLAGSLYINRPQVSREYFLPHVNSINEDFENNQQQEVRNSSSIENYVNEDPKNFTNSALRENYVNEDSENFTNSALRENYGNNNQENYGDYNQENYGEYNQENFQPSATNFSKEYQEVQYKEQPPFTETTNMPNIKEQKHWIDIKYLSRDPVKILQNGFKNNNNEHNDLLFGQNPIMFFLILLFIISLLYVGSY